VPNRPGRHGGRGTIAKPTYDVDELRANDFCIVKPEDGYFRMAEGLGDFFKNSKPKQKKDE
jgi:hypothetical protein